MKIGHIPEERRLAACGELTDLIKALNDGAASLSKKIQVLCGADPRDHQKAISNLRRYRTYGLPCPEEVAAIEARMLGTTAQAVRETDHNRIDAKERERIVREAQRGMEEVSVYERGMLFAFRMLPQEKQELLSLLRAMTPAQRSWFVAWGQQFAAECARKRRRASFRVIEGGAQH